MLHSSGGRPSTDGQNACERIIPKERFHVVGVAENANEAMKRLLNQQVDLALVDVVLPKIKSILEELDLNSFRVA